MPVVVDCSDEVSWWLYLLRLAGITIKDAGLPMPGRRDRSGSGRGGGRRWTYPKRSALLDKLLVGEPVIVGWSMPRGRLPEHPPEWLSDPRITTHVRVYPDDLVEPADSQASRAPTDRAGARRSTQDSGATGRHA